MSLENNIEKVLTAWQIQIKKNRDDHKTLSIKYKQRHYWIGIPATIIGSLATSGSLALTGRPFFGINPRWIDLTFDLCTALITAAIALQTFLGSEDKSVKHKEAANKYDALARLIENILISPIETRGSSSDIINSIRKQFDYIVNSSPTLPVNQTDLSIYSPPPIDIESTPINIDTHREFSEQMGREQCEIHNANNSYGVLNAIRYQLDRLDR